MYIWPNLHFSESLFSRIDACQIVQWPNVHFPENLFSRIETSQNVHLAECLFPRKLIFQKLYTLARIFVIDRIDITKTCNHAVSLSRIIQLRVERKGQRKAVSSRWAISVILQPIK